jgi:hypothetical protein
MTQTVTLHAATQFNDDHDNNRTLKRFGELATKYYGKPVEVACPHRVGERFIFALVFLSASDVENTLGQLNPQWKFSSFIAFRRNTSPTCICLKCFCRALVTGSLTLFFLAGSATVDRSASRSTLTVAFSADRLIPMWSSRIGCHLSRDHSSEKTGRINPAL